MHIEPKPAYLKVKTPKQAMIAFHAAEVENLRRSLADQREFSARHHQHGGFEITAAWFAEYDQMIADAKWEDGSLSAIWRDRLAFHEAALEFLTHA